METFKRQSKTSMHYMPAVVNVDECCKNIQYMHITVKGREGMFHFQCLDVTFSLNHKDKIMSREYFLNMSPSAVPLIENEKRKPHETLSIHIPLFYILQ